MPHDCEMMALHLAESPPVVTYLPKFREYGLPVYDGGTSFVIAARRAFP